MKRVVPQVLFFVVAAAVLAAGRNTVLPGGIPWVGQWGKPVVAEGDSVPKSQSAQPDDPPFLTIEQAKAMYEDPNVIFVDARYPEDYAGGHIKGAILLPFEMLDDYWPGMEERLPRDKTIVTYCSGEDCELSLFLARYLRAEHGYKNLAIFFGGATKWHEHNMPMDTTPAPPPGA